MRIVFKRSLFLLLGLCLAACQAFAPGRLQPESRPAIESSPAVAQLATPEMPASAPVLTATVAASATPFPPAAATLAGPAPTETLGVIQAAEGGFRLRWHPDGPLYAGDQVSLEALAPPGEDWAGKSLQVELETPGGKQILGAVDFAPFGLGGRMQATLWWFWDTTGLAAGPYTLTFTLLPEGRAWQETVTLLPAADLAATERQAAWASVESQCCKLYYVTGSAAERDLEKLVAMTDEQARYASQKLGVQISEKIPIVLLPRVLGHGGFTAQEIAVTYLDRNYAGSGTELTIHHEIVHWLDDKLGGELRPSLLVEGLAVYLTGGHFKPEPLIARAAALLAPQPGCTPVSFTLDDTGAAVPSATPPTTRAPACGLDRYIPLVELTDNFYPSQHEIGYLEAGALVEYMVETWGWAAFVNFYRDIHSQPPATERAITTGDSAVVPAPYPSQSAALDAALQSHFQTGLVDLEQGFITALSQEALTPALVADVHLTVGYFDTLRRYQQLLDPSAHYLSAWLADTVEMRRRAIVADYLRKPEQEDNQALEWMLIAADTALRAGEYTRAAELLAAVNAALDQVSNQFTNGSQ